jgi:branched-chain amino acid transport system permease protein
MDFALQQLVNGLTQGMVYALIALGYTMVYGIIELINFAHGEVFMVGSFAGLLAAGAMAAVPGIPAPVRFLVALLAAMGACGALGLVLERAAYRPLRRAPRLAPLITAIGASYFLQNAVMLTLGSQQHAYPEIAGERTFAIGGATISIVQVLIVVIATALMAALTLFIGRTRTGRAMRACAADREAAWLMGVNVDRIIATTFAVGSLLAGAGGVLYGMRYGTIDFFMGYLVGIKAFTAAVLGGIGNVPGAMLGGVLLGMIEAIVAGWGASQWKDVVAFGVLVAVLLVRPSGLLGEREADKV